METIDMSEYKLESAYRIARGSINSAVLTLNDASFKYVNSFLDNSNILYRELTLNMFIILEKKNLLDKNSINCMYSEAYNLKNNIQKDNSDYIDIATKLSRIVETKIGIFLLPLIDKKGTEASKIVAESICGLSNSCNVLANNKFSNVIQFFNEYEKNIVEKLNLGEKPDVKSEIINQINIFKKEYLVNSFNDNNLLFSNFSRLIIKISDYLSQYAMEVDNLEKKKIIDNNINNQLDGKVI